MGKKDKGKQKKGGDDLDDLPNKPAAEEGAEPELSRAQKRAAKKLTKGGGASEKSEKGLSNMLTRLNVDDDSDQQEEDEDEEPPVAPVSKKNKKKAKQQEAAKSFAMLSDSDDDNENDEDPTEQKEEEEKEEGEGASAAELVAPPPLSETKPDGGDVSAEGSDELAQLLEKEESASLSKDEKRRLKELKKTSDEAARSSKPSRSNGLSKEEKRELKGLKAKKEQGDLSKEEKRRYKDLKSTKKGAERDDDDGDGDGNDDDADNRKGGGAAESRQTSSSPAASASWPPPAAKLEETAAVRLEQQPGPSETVIADKQPAKMTKLQLKMEKAKQRKQELEKEKAASAAPLTATAVAATAVDVAPSIAAGASSGAAMASAFRGESGAAAEEDDDEAVASEKKERQQQRVFNLGDDDGWKDASVPGSSLAPSVEDEGEISEVGPDGKKRTKKEMKKLERDRELRLKAKEQYDDEVKRSVEGAQFSCSQTSVDERDPIWQNSLDINIPSITISAYNKNLFVDAPLTIAHGRHYGLVGPNGKGKSTLLKMIASGALKIPPRIDALYVEQEVLADHTPSFEAVLMADKPRWALVTEEREIVASLAEGGDEAKDARLAAVYEEMAAMDAAAAEPKARRILFGLGFDSEMQNRPTKEFSGGWRMRISLARALFIEPTLLMLDEPTNHLDLNAVIWLDDYLQKWKKTLLIVSHDQDFLNTTCEEILHLNAQKLDSYRGNYDTFKQLEDKKREQAQKAWELEQKRIKQLKAGGTTKAKANEQVMNKKSKDQGGAKKKKSDAIASGTGGAEMKELLERPREYQVTLQFGEVQKLQPPVIQVMDVGFRYSPQLPPIFNSLNFGVDMESRVCVVGNNGSGKSTLIKLLIGEVNASRGEIRRNPRLRVGVYNQHFVDKLPMDSSPVEYLRNSFDGLDYQSARNILGKFGLEGHAHEIAMRDLSGGQKARVTFCELTLSKPHVLFLDEPTNNLDIESIDALCEAINAYEGGMVVVTHDARLIEATDSQLWVVEDGEVIAWDGGFSTYREHLLRKLDEQMEALHLNKTKTETKTDTKSR